MEHKKEFLLLLTLLFLPPALIFASRNLLPHSYLFSSLYKLVFLYPLFHRIIFEKKSFIKSLSEHFSWRTFRVSLRKTALFGLLVGLTYYLAYLFFKHNFTTQTIIQNLQESATINTNNLLMIGIYIIFVNSLLEEYFWRGFLFEKLIKNSKPIFAYLITGIAFSFHHLVFYFTWFTWPFLLLATFGLVSFALLMNYIFQKYHDLFSCWLIHLCADTAQILIALKIFGLL
ncbi:MAG: type II CAAX endopeptidase family protein [Nanoarchaeota archaeon]|nr:type II CAAX endopeptidase family protein [Nanoarchaeota archaeon]